MDPQKWTVHNASGDKRVVVTKALPGDRWLEILTRAQCRVEVCSSTEVLSVEDIKSAIGDRCDGAIGQLTEDWGEEAFACLKAAGGTAYSNYAVGFNNVDLNAATRHGIPVGNTPGVLTETTAEMAVALTFAAARRVGESERFLRGGRYEGWLPSLFLGELLWRKTVGIIGAGRIGEAYAHMMIHGHKMNLVYQDICRNSVLEESIAAYGKFLETQGMAPVTCTYAEKIDDLLKASDCVSVHTVLDESTHHLINRERLSMMKEDAILVNISRGPVVDEAALVTHCKNNPTFRAGLDVFEDEPALKPGLSDLDNVVIVPHIASATRWTREGMATLAASNIAGILMGYPVWENPEILPFLGVNPPKAAPSILNRKEVGFPLHTE